MHVDGEVLADTVRLVTLRFIYIVLGHMCLHRRAEQFVYISIA